MNRIRPCSDDHFKRLLSSFNKITVRYLLTKTDTSKYNNLVYSFITRNVDSRVHSNLEFLLYECLLPKFKQYPNKTYMGFNDEIINEYCHTFRLTYRLVDADNKRISTTTKDYSNAYMSFRLKLKLGQSRRYFTLSKWKVRIDWLIDSKVVITEI